MGFFLRYLGPAERVSMETAARTDSQIAAAVSAGLTAGFGGDGHAGEGGSTDTFEDPVDPELFEPKLYTQPALTSRAIDPEECRCVSVTNYSGVWGSSHALRAADGVGCRE